MSDEKPNAKHQGPNSTTNVSGGVNVNSQGDTSVQGDVVGRDKIVNVILQQAPKNQQATNNLPAFQNARQIAYEKLWELLPDLSTLHKRKNEPRKANELFEFFSEEELKTALPSVSQCVRQ